MVLAQSQALSAVTLRCIEVTPALLLAIWKTGPWEDDAYFITKGSTLSAKRVESHCTVIGKWPLVVSELV